jgi:hypothetical protein
MRKFEIPALISPFAHFFGFARRRVSPPKTAPTRADESGRRSPARHLPASSATSPRQVAPAPTIEPIVCMADYRAARRRERARCLAILTCDGASTWPGVAAALAFDTTLTRKEAIAVLQLPVFRPGYVYRRGDSVVH